MKKKLIVGWKFGMLYVFIIIFTLYTPCLADRVPKCFTQICREQIENITRDVDLNVEVCDDWHKLACNHGKAKQNYAIHIYEAIKMWRSMYHLLRDPNVEKKTRDYPLLAGARRQFLACGNGDELKDAKCWNNLTLPQQIGAIQLKLNQTITASGRKMAQALAEKILEGLKRDPSLLRYRNTSVFYTKQLPSMRIEVGYPRNFDQLEHTDYLNESSIARVEESYNQGDRLKPLPYWPIDLIPKNIGIEPVHSYHNESNTIYIPPTMLMSKLFFDENALDVYNYAGLGIFVVRCVMKEFLKTLRGENITSLHNGKRVPWYYHVPVDCVKRRFKKIQDYTSESKVAITDEIIDDIIIDFTSLRAACALFDSIVTPVIYDITTNDRFNNIRDQFFLFYARTFCYDRDHLFMRAFPNITNVRDFGYYRLIISLLATRPFHDRFNCNNGTMEYYYC